MYIIQPRHGVSQVYSHESQEESRLGSRRAGGGGGGGEEERGRGKRDEERRCSLKLGLFVITPYGDSAGQITSWPRVRVLSLHFTIFIENMTERERSHTSFVASSF